MRPGFPHLICCPLSEIPCRRVLVPAHRLADVPRPAAGQLRVGRQVQRDGLVIEAGRQRRLAGGRRRRGHKSQPGALGADVAFPPAAEARPDVIHRTILPIFVACGQVCNGVRWFPQEPPTPLRGVSGGRVPPGD